MRQPSFYVALVLGFLTSGTAQATDYKFAVSCQYDRFAILWQTGDIDPGREYLKFTTGTKYPDCSVSDFDQARDGNLRVADRFSHEGGVISGVPLIGTVICGIFGC
jgi:hypothetical protein